MGQEFTREEMSSLYKAVCGELTVVTKRAMG